MLNTSEYFTGIAYITRGATFKFQCNDDVVPCIQRWNWCWCAIPWQLPLIIITIYFQRFELFAVIWTHKAIRIAQTRNGQRQQHRHHKHDAMWMFHFSRSNWCVKMRLFTVQVTDSFVWPWDSQYLHIFYDVDVVLAPNGRSFCITSYTANRFQLRNNFIHFIYIVILNIYKQTAVNEREWEILRHTDFIIIPFHSRTYTCVSIALYWCGEKLAFFGIRIFEIEKMFWLLSIGAAQWERESAIEMAQMLKSNCKCLSEC